MPFIDIENYNCYTIAHAVVLIHSFNCNWTKKNALNQIILKFIAVKFQLISCIAELQTHYSTRMWFSIYFICYNKL